MEVKTKRQTKPKKFGSEGGFIRSMPVPLYMEQGVIAESKQDRVTISDVIRRALAYYLARNK